MLKQIMKFFCLPSWVECSFYRWVLVGNGRMSLNIHNFLLLLNEVCATRWAICGRHQTRLFGHRINLCITWNLLNQIWSCSCHRLDWLCMFHNRSSQVRNGQRLYCNCRKTVSDSCRYFDYNSCIYTCWKHCYSLLQIGIKSGTFFTVYGLDNNALDE